MSDVQATPAASTPTTTAAAAPAAVYYEFTTAVAPQLPTYTGRSFTTDSPNTTTVAPPAVTDPTAIQYWINGAWFVGKQEAQITASNIKQYINDVVYTRATLPRTKVYTSNEAATFDAQYQGALAVKAGQTSDLVTELATIRGITAADMATIIVSKHDSVVANHLAYAKATYGLQAQANEATSLDAALASGLVELFPLLEWLNDPSKLSHKILSQAGV